MAISHEEREAIGVNPSLGPTFADVVARRLSRRDLLKAGLVLGAATAVRPLLRPLPAIADSSGPSFAPIAAELDDAINVPPGFRSDVLIGWGDPLFPGVPDFTLDSQTALLQERRFGFNCDYLMFMPLPAGSASPRDGLLWVNHEYTDGAMMFPGYDAANPTAEQVAIELAAHGASIVRVESRAGEWRCVVDPRRNRRLTATTPMLLSGPAAGDPLLRTAADPTGTLVLGMLNNCGGGVTPWGTVLTAEENFNQYFANNAALPAGLVKTAHSRYGLPSGPSERRWENHVARFDLASEPHEPFRFGWVVEVDPYDPAFVPVKRTALGRLKHEAAAMTLSGAGRAVVYTGDDERFEYAYKFVSDGTYDPADRAANLGLLDAGTLYVARFDDGGGGEWLPLRFGEGPLVAPAFSSQADVLIRARAAADALGATKMDRPEDFEVNLVTGVVYLALTNNTRRGTGTNPAVDAANPRAGNRYGHIIEIHEAGGDHAAGTFRWEIFLLCGDPSDPSTFFAGFDKTQVSTIANPDNITFDRHGALWIATDGQPGSLGVNDAVHAVPTQGSERGHVKQFLSAVPGAEVASLAFNANEQALFASIQHPGEGGSLAAPTSTWPSGPGGYARPSVVVVTAEDGGPVTR